ncbi:oligopeptide/dipeptide ABC transporter ATP-binding protein [Halomicrobium sp. HM KBTZ05]|uniref:oligopeptide/dipeptide ABC transporter ATP-binding protein n=1 Tax=Halomicrobium sp. HM KBTZ05 TaxID=3242663 RepID=UPI00355896A2
MTERPDAEGEPLLAVEGLERHYPITEGWLRREVGRVRAVDGVSFEIREGEAFGLVGESGSGKTTLAHTLLGLEERTGGTVRFDGDPVSELSDAERRSFRRRVQLVVQDPNEAFNPRIRVGEAVAEPLALNGMDDADRRRAIVEDLLERVGLDAADTDRYPHEFSDGEKQRLAIARALVVDPDLVVADEPTSALDARVKSDILALLEEVRREFDVSLLFVSHDIDVVRRFCDRVAVMYLGEIVERGPTHRVLDAPAHPYTEVLLDSVPSLDPSDRSLVRPLTDTIPDPADPPSGCRFHTRCPAIVGPEELSAATWERLASFRFTVQTGELPASIDLADPPDPATIRSVFDLPGAIDDEAIAEGVDDAVAALADGDLDRASERLAAVLPSVCEQQVPATVTVDGRPVKCHRHDPAIDAEPRPE